MRSINCPWYALESGWYLNMSFRSKICRSISCRTRAFVPSRLQLNWRNRDTLSLLCRPIERISCLKMPVNDCNLTNVKLYLNSEFYSYDDLNVHLAKIYFGKNRYVILFDMYARFHKAYYGYDCYETLLTVSSFLSNSYWPLAIKQVHQKRQCKCTVITRMTINNY